ncbi:malate/lactate/ureidoglycolate dehydrogenase [Piscinibacter sakaiensis]|uniref:malate/lactate/ureidoglycolate dehydrogenase n=1 Tax=Piscinibacter sakaiensis TaxID=1547922 RepID=UPI003AAB6EA0
MDDRDVVVMPDALTLAVETLFSQAGSEAREAELVAAQLVGANLTGHDSHGVGMIPRYVEVLLAGDLRLNAHPRPVLDAGAISVLDGEYGLGQVAGFEAMQQAIALAKQHGLALTGLRNSHHLGRIGHWAEQCSAAGLISLHFVNVISIPMVAPFGGRQARLVTNPVAVGVPRQGKPPLILDFATSKIAVGKVRVALNEGKQLAPDTLLDRDGEPTRDPAALFDKPHGALMPFGGHKGSGLALMCEILGAALIGGPVMSGAPASRRIVNNMLTIAIDPDFFAEHGALDASIDELLEWVRSAPAVDPATGVLVAGEPELAARAARAAGIRVDAKTWSELEHAADLVGLTAQQWNRCAGVSRPG